MRVLWPVVVGLSGCFANYETIEEACPSHVHGERFVAPDDVEVIHRFSCYRRYVGLTSLKVTEPVQRAVQNHVDYLDENRILAEPNISSNDIFNEDMNRPLATGVNVFDRLMFSQAIDSTADIGVWSLFLTELDDRLVDGMLRDPFMRDAIFQPLLIGTGYAEFETDEVVYSYMNIVYTVPPARRVEKPIVYPKDGQLDVPLHYDPFPHPDNPLAVRTRIGFPISITVGAWEAGTGENPYGVILRSATLEGPDGELDTVSALPARYPTGDNQATVIVAPVAPLLPNTTYTLTATLTWNAKTDKVVTTTFTTGDGFDDVEPDDTGAPTE